MFRNYTKRVLQPATRGGTTTVEFALVAPAFFLIIFALMEFAWTNVVRHTADNAAYEAARAVMVPGASSNEATNVANRILGIVGARGVKVTVNPAKITPETQQITVEVDIPLNQNAIVTPRFVGGGTIHSEATLRTERVEVP